MVEYKNPGRIEFEDIIQINESNASGWVKFPYDLKELYGRGNLVPVVITFDKRVKYQGSLAKRGSDYAMVFLRKDILAALNKAPGQKVHVAVELDSSERKIELAKDVLTKLNKEPQAQQTWDKLPYSHQREYHQWIEEAKRPDTRKRRIDEFIKRLLTGK